MTTPCASNWNPRVANQPTEVRARLVQNERLDFGRFVMEPVKRVDANIGEIDATNRPAFLREANPTGTLVRDMGDLVYVTDPLHADEFDAHRTLPDEVGHEDDLPER